LILVQAKAFFISFSQAELSNSTTLEAISVLLIKVELYSVPDLAAGVSLAKFFSCLLIVFVSIFLIFFGSIFQFLSNNLNPGIFS